MIAIAMKAGDSTKTEKTDTNAVMGVNGTRSGRMYLLVISTFARTACGTSGQRLQEPSITSLLKHTVVLMTHLTLKVCAGPATEEKQPKRVANDSDSHLPALKREGELKVQGPAR